MIVLYAATRNLYPYMLPSITSLLEHNTVEKIIMLLEDDTFPAPLPDCCEIRNVVEYRDKYLDPDGVNVGTYFSWQAMLRVAYPLVLQDLDKVLSLDVDTIICDSLEPLWNTDLTGKWMAMVPEKQIPPFRSAPYRPDVDVYYNCGVTLYNLKQLREDNMVPTFLEKINTVLMDYIEQDTFNEYGSRQGKIVALPNRYNECVGTGETDNPAIVHFAGHLHWMRNMDMPRRPYLDKYRHLFMMDLINRDQAIRELMNYIRLCDSPKIQGQTDKLVLSPKAAKDILEVITQDDAWLKKRRE